MHGNGHLNQHEEEKISVIFPVWLFLFNRFTVAIFRSYGTESSVEIRVLKIQNERKRNQLAYGHIIC